MTPMNQRLDRILRAPDRTPAHEARLDFAMLASSCVLFSVGAGAFSLDAWLRKRLGQQQSWQMTLRAE